MKFVLLINIKIPIILTFFLLNRAEREIYLAKNIKMPTVVGILIFISKINFMLS